MRYSFSCVSCWLALLLAATVGCTRRPTVLPDLATRPSSLRLERPAAPHPPGPERLPAWEPAPLMAPPPAARTAATVRAAYEQAYQELARMLAGQRPLRLKRAVFVTENAYFANQLDYREFCAYVADLTLNVRTVAAQTDTLLRYSRPDKPQVLRNAALFRVMRDTIRFRSGWVSHPFRYDFTDFTGEQDWRQMFVSKLLVHHTGNCHSLPLLYKIVADEIGAPAWLALAPNHIYLKQHNQQAGWYNTELTSGTFPNDAWLMASGYVIKETVVSGIYLDTLSAHHNVALCLVDLAKGYERRLGSADYSFTLRCADLALQYFPRYINAQLLRAEALRRQFEQQPRSPATTQAYAAMEAAYTRVAETGYREIPPQLYAEWLQLVQREKNKYQTTH